MRCTGRLACLDNVDDVARACSMCSLARAPPVVEAVGQVAVLLHLEREHARADAVRRARRNVHDVAFLRAGTSTSTRLDLGSVDLGEELVARRRPAVTPCANRALLIRCAGRGSTRPSPIAFVTRLPGDRPDAPAATAARCASRNFSINGKLPPGPSGTPSPTRALASRRTRSAIVVCESAQLDSPVRAGRTAPTTHRSARRTATRSRARRCSFRPPQTLGISQRSSKRARARRGSGGADRAIPSGQSLARPTSQCRGGASRHGKPSQRLVGNEP